MTNYKGTDIIWLCPKCGGVCQAPKGEKTTENNKCPLCDGNLIETSYTDDEYTKNREAIRQEYIYSRPDYDPEEMDYWNSVSTQRMKESAKKLGPIKKPEPEENKNTPKCPICQSTNLSKISTAKKVGKIAMFGIFGMGDNGKTWQCNNCGSKF